AAYRIEPFAGSTATASTRVDLSPPLATVQFEPESILRYTPRPVTELKPRNKSVGSNGSMASTETVWPKPPSVVRPVLFAVHRSPPLTVRNAPATPPA